MIPIQDFIIGLIIFLPIMGIIFLLVKKQNARKAALVDSLSQEVKDRLYAAEIFPMEGRKDSWSQEAYIAEAVDKGSKMAVTAMYCNRVIENNSFNEIEFAEFKIDKTTWESKNLQIGSFVNMFIDPNKCEAGLVD